MKKLIFACLALGIIVNAAWADNYKTLTNLLQFHASIAELTGKNASIDPNKMYLVEGMVTSIEIINDSDATFYAEVEFMSAEYGENESIQSFRIKLVFANPAFKPILAPKTARTILSGQIGINSRGLALIQYLKSEPGSKGLVMPVFIAHDFRILK